MDSIRAFLSSAGGLKSSSHSPDGIDFLPYVKNETTAQHQSGRLTYLFFWEQKQYLKEVIQPQFEFKWSELGSIFFLFFRAEFQKVILSEKSSLVNRFYTFNVKFTILNSP